MKVVEEAKKEKVEKVSPKYTTIIVSQDNKKIIREFKLKYMDSNKVYKLSDIGLLLALIKFYEQNTSK
jgi:hypothetical protein